MFFPSGRADVISGISCGKFLRWESDFSDAPWIGFTDAISTGINPELQLPKIKP